MTKISHKSIEELISSQLEYLANSSDEQNDVVRYGFKGILKMNEEELLKEFQSHGITTTYDE